MRRLATFAYTFAFGVLFYQYLLSPETIFWGGGPVAVLLLLGVAMKGDRRFRLLLMAAALAAGLVWSGAYDLWLSQPARNWGGEVITVQAEVTDYALPSSSGGRKVAVWLDGENGPACKAMCYGGKELESLSPGDRITSTVYLQDAALIRGRDVYSFTAKGYQLLLYPRGEMTVEPGGDPWYYLPRRIAHLMEKKISELYDGEAAPFLTAMLLGDPYGPEDITDIFSRLWTPK